MDITDKLEKALFIETRQSKFYPIISLLKNYCKHFKKEISNYY